MHDTSTQTQTSINDIQQSIIESFQCLGNWMARYEYLIDLGRSMPALPVQLRSEENRLHGCQAQVWLVSNQVGDRLFFQASSDSAIVTGLLALLLNVYSGRSANEILANPPDFLRAIELDQHLSPHRANGLFHMLTRIRSAAQRALQTHGSEVNHDS